MNSSLIALIVSVAGSGIEYPETPRVDHVDVLHGTTVADPYRWLEEDVRADRAVSDWVDAQNVVTNGYLSSIPQRDAIRNRLGELWNYEKIRTPYRVGDRIYFSANSGLQNQDVLYSEEPDDEAVEVVLDPNTWSEDGNDLGGTSTVRTEGTSHMPWPMRKMEDVRIRPVDGVDLPDRIRWSNSPPGLDARRQAFYYGRYDAPAATPTWTQRVHEGTGTSPARPSPGKPCWRIRRIPGGPGRRP